MLSIGQLEKMSIDSPFFFNLNTDDGLLLDEQLLLSSEDYFQSEKLEQATKPMDSSDLPFKGSTDLLGFNFMLPSDGPCNADSLSLPEVNNYHLPHILNLTRNPQGNPEPSSRGGNFPEGSLNSMLLLSYPNPPSTCKENFKPDLSLQSQDPQFPSFVFPNSGSAMTTSPLSTPTSYLITPIYEDSLAIDPTSICRPCDILEFDDSFTKSLGSSILSEKSELLNSRHANKRPSIDEPNGFSLNNKRRNSIHENDRTISEFDMGNQSLFEDLFKDLEADEVDCCKMSEIADPGDIADIINEFLDTESSEGTLEKEDADSDYTPSSSRRSSISSFGPEEVTNSCLVKDRTCDGNIRCSTSKKQIKNSPRRTSRKKSIVENVDIKEPEEGDHDKTVTVYSCDFPSCGKTFTRLYNLKSHYRTHTDDRPFACDKCDQTFSRNHDLKRHYKIHSGVKPFNCEHCGKKFSRMDALGRHRAKRPQCRE